MDKKNQLLRNPKVNPTDEIIADGLSEAINAYIKFIDLLKHNDIELMNWRYYKDGKAWLSKGEYKWKTKRGTDKVKTIFWLSIWEGFFKVSFFFLTNMKSELLSLPISKETKKVISDIKPMGKTMRFIPIILDVYDAFQLDDLLVLAQYKKENL